MNDVRFILVVDDDAECSATLELALQSLLGTTVVVAGSAEAALDIVGQGSGTVAAVVTDLHLPGMTGLELVAVLRGNGSTAQIPIVVVSAATNPSMPQQTLAAGACAFFAKPFSPGSIRLCVTQLLQAPLAEGFASSQLTGASVPGNGGPQRGAKLA